MNIPFKPKSFDEFINEAVTKGVEIENTVKQGWNFGPEIFEGFSKEVAEKMISFLQKQIKGSDRKAEATRIGGSNIKISNTWKEFGGINGTPKTDVKIGSSKLSIKYGDAQLMSGGSKEVTATFLAACENLGMAKNKTIKGIISDVENTFTRSKTMSSDVSTELKSKINNELDRFNSMNKKLMSELKDYFEKNEKLYLEFIKESITGEVKFANNDGTCNYVYCTGRDGNYNKLYKASDTTFIKKIKDKTYLQIRFKSNSDKVNKVKTGKYNYWTVLSLITKNIDAEPRLKNENLTESMISDIMKTFFEYVKELLLKVIAWIKESFLNLLEFFGIETEIEYSEKIVWDTI